MERFKELPDVLKSKALSSCVGVVEVEEGVIEMDVRMSELNVQKKREWEREDDVMMNSMEEKVIFSQCLTVNTEREMLSIHIPFPPLCAEQEVKEREEKERIWLDSVVLHSI